MKTIARTLLLSMVMMAAGLSRAEAGLITYTESGMLTGSLGSTQFSDKLVTITATGDTSSLATVRPGVFSVNVTATVTIDGIAGSATITDSIIAFVNQNTSVAGFADTTVQRDTFNLINASFAHYDLVSSIGPVTGTVNFVDGGAQDPISTTAGALRLMAAISRDVTFQATLASQSVPEPSSIALCGIAGTLGLAARARRKRLN